MQIWETVNIPMGIYMLNFKTSYFKKGWLVIEVPYSVGILRTQRIIWHIQFCWRREQALGEVCDTNVRCRNTNSLAILVDFCPHSVRKIKHLLCSLWPLKSLYCLFLTEKGFTSVDHGNGAPEIMNCVNH